MMIMIMYNNHNTYDVYNTVGVRVSKPRPIARFHFKMPSESSNLRGSERRFTT